MSQTTVLHVGGLHWATSERAVETALLRRPGVEAVEANAVNQTASVTFDPSATSLGELAAWVRDCGYHCAGRSVPNHVCSPTEEAATRERRTPEDEHAAHGAVARHTACNACAVARRAHCAGADGPRRPRGHVDGRHGPRHAQPVRRRRRADDRNHLVVTDGSGPARLHGAGTVRPARRRLRPRSQPAGGVLLRLDLLRRCLPCAAQPHARHDGARRRRGRSGLALQRGRDPHRRGRGVLRGGCHADHLRAPWPLVRDAGAGWCQRGHPRPDGPGTADGHRPTRRRACGGAHRRGAGRRPAPHPTRREGSCRRPRRGRRSPRSTSRWSLARAFPWPRRRGRRSSAPPSTPLAR